MIIVVIKKYAIQICVARLGYIRTGEIHLRVNGQNEGTALLPFLSRYVSVSDCHFSAEEIYHGLKLGAERIHIAHADRTELAMLPSL